MKYLQRIYTLASTAALCALAVAYSYESSLNQRYESGQLVNASQYEQRDWLTLVQEAAQ
jgi:hypothetical protein